LSTTRKAERNIAKNEKIQNTQMSQRSDVTNGEAEGQIAPWQAKCKNGAAHLSLYFGFSIL